MREAGSRRSGATGGGGYVAKAWVRPRPRAGCRPGQASGIFTADVDVM